MHYIQPMIDGICWWTATFQGSVNPWPCLFERYTLGITLVQLCCSILLWWDFMYALTCAIFREAFSLFFLCISSIFEELRSWLLVLDQVIPQEQIDIQTSILAELQKRVVKAEATIGQKEEENAALQEQLQQYEKRWSDYEAKMKAMEEMWQMQMLSLQVSLLVNINSLLSAYIICFILWLV